LRECFNFIKTTLSDAQIYAEYFGFLAKLLNQEKFLGLGGGYYFLMLLQEIVLNLSANEQQSLLPAIEIANEAFNKDY
jgi:hypothetical protein